MIPLFLSLFLANVLIIPEGASTAQSSQPVQAKQTVSENSAQDSQSSDIGTVVELKGQATAALTDQAVRSLAEGDPIYQNETISTGSGSTLQIELKDESLFTISENTKIKMDSFIYDESSQNGNLAASVTKGIFRFVSGKIEKINPEKVNIDTPSGTIGIRGTIVVGQIEGEKCLVALEPEEGDTQQHRIVVFNHAGGKRNEIEITKPGFATQLESRNQPPRPIFQMPEQKRALFQRQLPKAPQFNQAARPGDPKRYEKLFDTNSMKQRLEHQQAQKDERNRRADFNQEDSQNRKPGGPHGPNGPNASQGRQDFQGREGNLKNLSQRAENLSDPEARMQKTEGFSEEKDRPFPNQDRSSQWPGARPQDFRSRQEPRQFEGSQGNRPSDLAQKKREPMPREIGAPHPKNHSSGMNPPSNSLGQQPPGGQGKPKSRRR